MVGRDPADVPSHSDPAIGHSLHEAEAKFRALIESFPDAVVLVGNDRRIKIANRRAEKLLGFAEGALYNRPIESLMPEDNRTECLARYDEFFELDDRPTMTVLDNLTGRRADGGYFPAQFILTPFQTSEALFVTTIVRDATERKLSEQVIRESVELAEAKEELEYKSTLLESQNEASVDGILIVDPDGHVVSYNQRFVDMWQIDPGLMDVGATDEPALASALDQLADPDGFLEKVEALVADPTASLRDEVQFKDGRVFERWSTPVISESGAYYGRGWYFRDITERVRAEERIRQQEQWFRAVTKYSGDAIIVIDGEGRRTFVSASAEALVGVPAPEQLGGPAFDRVHPDDVSRVQAEFEHALQEPGVPHKVEYRMLHANGDYVHVESVGVNMLDDPAVEGIIVNTRDVTERRRAEEALKEAYDQLKEHERFRLQFLNNVSHDLGGSLTPVTLQAKLLASGELGDLTPRQAKALDLLDGGIEQLTLLVQDLKDVARMEAGQLRMRPDPVELEHVVSATVEAFEALADSQGVELEVDAADDLTAFADARRIRQVLTNLLSNALKFTPEGGRIVVAAQRHNGDVLVQVQDTGKGMRPDQVARLFQPFSQVHDRSEGHYKGTGLGLYICKGIIEQHGGRIWCESNGPGQGATFAFTVPMDDPGTGTEQQGTGRAQA